MNSLMTAIPPLLNHSTSSSSSTLHPSNDTQLSQADYPLVRFWTISPYNIYMAEKKEANENQGVSIKKLRGGSRMGLDINVNMLYLEDEQGVSVSGSRARLARNVAHGIWQQLLGAGLSPATWGLARNDVSLQFYRELGAQVPEMRLCADNWKAKQMAKAIYPSWYNTYGKRKIIVKLESSASTSDTDDSEMSTDDNIAERLVATSSQKHLHSADTVAQRNISSSKRLKKEGDTSESDVELPRAPRDTTRPRLTASLFSYSRHAQLNLFSS